MISVTLKHWNDLRGFADRLADDAERFLGNPTDPDWETFLVNTVNEYNEKYPR